MYLLYRLICYDVIVLLQRTGSNSGQFGKKDVTYWWCAVRNNKLRCPAVVVQKGQQFVRGKRKHEHLVGQNTPKPHAHDVGSRGVGDSGSSWLEASGSSQRSSGSEQTPTTSSSRRRSKKPLYDSRSYQIIKGGSKAGMDLLKDKFGYTFTLKKVDMNENVGPNAGNVTLPSKTVDYLILQN